MERLLRRTEHQGIGGDFGARVVCLPITNNRRARQVSLDGRQGEFVVKKRGQVDKPLRAAYLTVSANSDDFGRLWRKRVILGWYPGKTLADAYLGNFILENINWRTGEFQAFLRENARHTTRSLADIAGLPQRTVAETIQRWEEMKFIGRYAPGPKRPGRLSISWDVIRNADEPQYLSAGCSDVSGERSDELSAECSDVSGERSVVSAGCSDVSGERSDARPLYKDNHSIHSSRLGGGARATSETPLAGANSSIKAVPGNDPLTTESEDPPMPPAARVAGSTKPVVHVGQATIGPGFGTDINNLNPHAQMVRQNRRYGALTMLDGSDGVVFDITLGKLSLVNGTLASFQDHCAERGLDLSAALVKAAVKVAKDPRNATPTMALAEINQALAYQEADKRKAPTSAGIKIDRGWGRGFKGF